MPWVCQAGATLLIPSGAGNHLFVILNSPTDFPAYPPQSCVLISFSTIRAGPYDTTRMIAGLYVSPLTPRYLKKLVIE